jgi:hypothetical protein
MVHSLHQGRCSHPAVIGGLSRSVSDRPLQLRDQHRERLWHVESKAHEVIGRTESQES